MSGAHFQGAASHDIAGPGDNERVPAVDRDLLGMDPESLRQFLWRELPARPGADPRGAHEVAWELGERFAVAGLDRQAALCRSTTTHEILAVWRWTRSFPDVPDAFWAPARDTLGPRPGPPPRAALGLASARGLLEAVGDGVALTAAGHLPDDTVRALDDRFRWTEEFPWMRAGTEADIPPLRFLHDHLAAQGLLARDGRPADGDRPGARRPRGPGPAVGGGRRPRSAVDP